MTETNDSKGSDLVNIDGASIITTFKVSRLRYMVRMDQIPYVKINRSVLFSRSDLKDWIKKMSHFPTKTGRQIAKELTDLKRKSKGIRIDDKD